MCDIAERKVHNEASSQRSSFKIERISLPLALYFKRTSLTASFVVHLPLSDVTHSYPSKQTAFIAVCFEG
jgi:hypothetical protein